jgi:hypothetical protein
MEQKEAGICRKLASKRIYMDLIHLLLSHGNT